MKNEILLHPFFKYFITVFIFLAFIVSLFQLIIKMFIAFIKIFRFFLRFSIQLFILLSFFNCSNKNNDEKFLQAQQFSKDGSYFDAIELLDDIVESDSTNTQAILLLGDCYNNREDFEKGKEIYLKGLLIDKNNKLLAYKMALCLFDLGLNDEAKNYFNKAIALGYEKYHPTVWLGIIYANEKKYDLAKDYFSLIIKDYPDSSFGYFMLGRTFFDRSEWDSARVNFNLAIKKNDNDPDNYYYLALIHNYLNDIDSSLFYIRKGIEINGTIPEYYFLKAAIYLLRKNNSDSSYSSYKMMENLINEENSVLYESYEE